MAKSKLTKAGGNRPGSGAKKKEPTKGINQRVPIKWHAHFVALVKAELKRLKDSGSSENGSNKDTSA